MRFARFSLLLFPLLFSISVWGQQTQQATASRAAPQDPQAVSVLNQALSVAGGAAAISAIQDYSATGTITYNPDQNLQGSVLIQGLGSTDFRMDATLPDGVRSMAITQGVLTTKAEDGKVSSFAPQTFAPSSDAFPYRTPLFASSIALPWHQLARVLGSRGFSVSYKGITQADGHSVHDIQFQRIPAGSASPANPILQPPSREVFIDTSTFQVVMTQEAVPKNSMLRVHYSGYRSVSSILMPFSIAEELDGSQVWSVQLSQVAFNTGLQESAFTIQ
ncbi:MAG TPA: hypothetical protein VGW37_19110 [Terriglobia bacterium]|nr:hypothetical protein [Terriglobia bacterium]